MRSWLHGFGKGVHDESSSLSKVDESAAFSSFVHHWKQTKETIYNSFQKEEVSNDDITAVINHFSKLINILVVDLQQMYQTAIKDSVNKNGHPIVNGQQLIFKTEWDPEGNGHHTPIFDHFMVEEILQTILNWSLDAREFVNILKLEMLKAYESILRQRLPEILVYKPIIGPLLTLLQSCSGCIPVQVEKSLVSLLIELCDILMKNPQLLDYFFHATDNQGPTKFLIFSLLLPFVHREGEIGQHARDALLLCMALSATHSTIGEYIAQYSNFCPVLAAGLSGLYSMLPRILKIETDGWYRISKADVASISELQMFINSLEFCNAVVQIGHPLVRKQLVEFLYQGFLVPVLGPALCQNVNNELVATIAYMELFLRAVTEPELQKPFLSLLLTQQDFSDVPLVSPLISHLHSSNLGLCLVTLGLFNTLVDLHSEDVMLVLIFQYLTPCTHVMLSQRSKVSLPPFNASERFLRLMPSVVQYENVMKSDPDQDPLSRTTSTNESDLNQGVKVSSFYEYLQEAQNDLLASSRSCSSWTWKYDGICPTPSQSVTLIHIARVTPAVPFSKPRVYSDPSPRSLQYNAQNHVGDKPRSSSLPDYSTRDSTATDCDKVPLRFNLFGQPNDSESFRRVIDSKIEPSRQLLPSRSHQDGSNSTSTSLGQSVIQESESRLDSLGESSGYGSISQKCSSRDSSPLHSTKGTPRYATKGTKNPLDLESEEEFFKFLENVADFDGDDGEGDLQCIDEAFAFLSPSGGSVDDASSGVFQVNSDEEDFPFGSLWSSPTAAPEDAEQDVEDEVSSPHPKPMIGPFLEVLIHQVEEMLSKNLHCAMLAMNCLTRLTQYPTPLLTSLLLQPSVVLQPAVRSLFQVLGKLKQRIDNILTIDDLPLLLDARTWLYKQFSPQSICPSPITPQPPSPSATFVRNDSKRLSLSRTMMAIFKRGPPDGGEQQPLYVRGSQPLRVLFSAPPQKRHAALCAVVLREWILELSACAQEHTVRSLGFEFNSVQPSRG